MLFRFYVDRTNVTTCSHDGTMNSDYDEDMYTIQNPSLSARHRYNSFAMKHGLSLKIKVCHFVRF